MQNVRDLLRLSSVHLIGPTKMRALLSHFETPADVLKASPRDLIRVPGIDKKLASNIAHNKDGDSFAEDQIKRVNKLGARILTIWDKEYPELLKRIYDPPALLYVLGRFNPKDRQAIAIVGTRQPSLYGQLVAEAFSQELSRLGISIVSGLARGIDTIVHTSTLRADGRTIAVIGSGLDVPYPRENEKLLEQIGETGVVVSEFPMGTTPDATNFPRRNRIISGLSLGTLVVESAVDGGAMITASTALDQDREVFAIPGNINENRSTGPNRLIQDGRAKLVQTVDDIVSELNIKLEKGNQRKEESHPLQLSIFEQKVYEMLGNDPIHIDDLAEAIDTSTSDVLVTLLSLEFKGLTRQLPGKMFVKM
ncbi:MAG TPA: DNA-processing protein DprA [Bacteroidota bacterium]|nr:DNA-processing protein DprA [Bacteroidota bacterium]